MDNPDSPSFFHHKLQNRHCGDWIYQVLPSELPFFSLSDTCYAKCPNPVYLASNNFDISFGDISFPCSDASLSRFLFASLSKQDILKPYSYSNVRYNSNSEIYEVSDATVICSPLSIAVLNSQNQIIRELSHNAPETLLAYYLANLSAPINQLNKAIFLSVQQTFNLGHWFIDSLPKLLLFREYYPNLDQIPVLLDTNTHTLVKTPLQHLSSCISLPTLPYSIFKVSNLYCPSITSFNQRLNLSNLSLNLFFPLRASHLNDFDELINQPPPKLFFSRQLLDRRRISNWDAVQTLLLENSYTIIDPQCLPICVVAYLVNNASHIIAPNGAAICNIVFKRSNKPLKVGIVYPSSHIDDYYFRVSVDLGLNFYGIVNDDTLQDLHYSQLLDRYYYPSVASDYSVSPARLQLLINHME